jgi:hypothetical protein
VKTTGEEFSALRHGRFKIAANDPKELVSPIFVAGVLWGVASLVALQ